MTDMKVRYYYDPRLRRSVDGYYYTDIYMYKDHSRHFLGRVMNDDWWKVMKMTRNVVCYLETYHSRMLFLTEKRKRELFDILDYCNIM